MNASIRTFRQADSIEDANAFASRLTALGKATEGFTSSAWWSAMMHDFVKVRPTSVDGMGDRIEIAGPVGSMFARPVWADDRDRRLS